MPYPGIVELPPPESLLDKTPDDIYQACKAHRRETRSFHMGLLQKKDIGSRTVRFSWAFSFLWGILLWGASFGFLGCHLAPLSMIWPLLVCFAASWKAGRAKTRWWCCFSRETAPEEGDPTEPHLKWFEQVLCPSDGSPQSSTCLDLPQTNSEFPDPHYSKT